MTDLSLHAIGQFMDKGRGLRVEFCREINFWKITLNEYFCYFFNFVVLIFATKVKRNIYYTEQKKKGIILVM